VTVYIYCVWPCIWRFPCQKCRFAPCIYRVDQNHIFNRCIQCIYGIFGREITKNTVIYGACIRFWPTLVFCSSVPQEHIFGTCGGCQACCHGANCDRPFQQFHLNNALQHFGVSVKQAPAERDEGARVRPHTHTHIHACTHTHTYTHANTHTGTHAYTLTHKHTRRHRHAQIQTHAHTCINTHTQTPSHTCINRHCPSRP
jgi:hypothetical protein